MTREEKIWAAALAISAQDADVLVAFARVQYVAGTTTPFGKAVLNKEALQKAVSSWATLIGDCPSVNELKKLLRIENEDE